MSKYPVGSTWKVTDPKTGMIGKIWLKEKDGQFEVWYWSSCFSDGSNYRFDWGRSYRAVRNECPVNGRFKRET